MIRKTDKLTQVIFGRGTILMADALRDQDGEKIQSLVISEHEAQKIGSPKDGTAGVPWKMEGVEIVFENYEGFEVFKHYVNEIDRRFRLNRWDK